MAVNTTKWQLGLTVATLVTWPEPDQGIDRPLSRIGGVQTSILGSNVSQTFAFKRTWTLNYTNLPDASFVLVAEFFDPNVATPGVYKGLGPFVLNDPDLTYQPTVNFTQMEESSVVNGSRAVVVTLVEV